MPIAEIDFSPLFSEKFLVGVGATTGSLAAFAIAVSFWLVKGIMDAPVVSAAKIALVRWFMALCGVVLLVSAAASVALAINNSRKTTVAETRAAAAIDRERVAVQTVQKAAAENAQLLADARKLHEAVSRTTASNEQLVAAMEKLRVEPSLSDLARRKVETSTRLKPSFDPKAATELNALLKKYAAPPR
ncbi:MAG: hypothetical protein HZA93_15840 [Verrucomicrobia bacterium]|nr:hypothetical protein [Verrucomicrobiota bacterium]